MQSNTQAIAETNANVENLRQATNERLVTVEQDVETIAATAASNTAAIATTNKRVALAESDIKNLMKVIDEIQTQYNTNFSQLQLMAQRSELKLEDMAEQFTKLASQKVSLHCLYDFVFTMC